MKKLLTVTILALAMPLAAWADHAAPPPCVPGTLADYVALNEHGGCTIGDKVFSDFTYQSSASGGANPLPDSGITVSPDDQALNPGLLFSGGWQATTGQTNDSLIGFTVTVMEGGGAIEDASLEIRNALTLGTGTVNVAETICLGGLPCTGENRVDLDVWQNLPGFDDQTYDHTTFAPVMTIEVTKDIMLVAGTQGAGFASLSYVTQNFSEVPEPATLTLFGTGLVAIGGMIRRRKNLKK